MGSAFSRCSVVARYDVEKQYFVLYVLIVGKYVCCYIAVD